ncbi:hypothetical protein PEPS_41840 (plasmid) [Persicobacter psychrovividus]|uniref:Uncharacterized protein n=1 Tax=Persicobacter psychrovividus TaxID=387638 RepID=A0ABN6LJW9_9BACT|nr:hypothetical protein PEPS_41840 [Persicobacter psychrovividus]
MFEKYAIPKWVGGRKNANKKNSVDRSDNCSFDDSNLHFIQLSHKLGCHFYDIYKCNPL